jgi:hypothetical protein
LGAGRFSVSRLTGERRKGGILALLATLGSFSPTRYGTGPGMVFAHKHEAVI